MDEIDILFRFGGHPNIVTLVEVYEDSEHACVSFVHCGISVCHARHGMFV
jgi:hypothetical protein